MIFQLQTPVAIQTRLSRAEVVARLQRSIDPPGAWFPLFGPFGLVGRTDEEGCWFENGSFSRKVNRRLTLQYRDGPDGTILHGQFALPLWQAIPAVAYLLFAAVFCVVSVVRMLERGSLWGATDHLWQLAPFGFLAAGLLSPKLSLWLSRGSEEELVDTLQQILKGPASRRGTWAPGSETVLRPRRLRR